jgi:Ca2+-binding RTX toxin-like protein
LGRDTINGYGGTNLFFGGPGDDTIMAANGTNTVIPGAGRDTIALGTGNDTVYIFDLCEVSAGETIDGGAGVDTLIAPVPLSELRALGVTVVNIEKFVVRPNSCRSECVTQPTCVHGQCAETKPTGAMACFCNEGYLGAKCERPLPARSEAERGGDYVGATDVGSLIVTVADGDASAPLVEDAVFRIKALDEGCIPSLETVCRYSMSVLRIRVSGFSVAGQTFTGATIRNDALIPITVGGNFGFTRPIPSSTRFTAWIEQPDKRFVSFLEAGTLNFTFHPAGSGSMALNGAFEGKVLDKDLTAEGSIIVSPLANVPPIANAGDDNNFAANDCVSTVTLNGTRSSDPNDNLESYLWRSRGFIVGRGATPAVRIPRSGLWKFELEARDSFRSTTRDTVVINATLPEHCGHL